ncbi:hypothetical protein [Ralstonia phage RP12]|uniref:Uncharacterized protein n=1 Tax=Ralstonia phage RP12 TaxID=1923889 RepID=A0A1L7N1A5_9CAUD|nr:hypothetical protein FDH28_gp137 [Ralstonia phage RP12]BAW19258.1 hypothetical protein [Ralstonia phage RP12]
MDKKELMDFVSHQVAHAAEDVAGSPALINRTVGEAMRHIGSFLEMSSSPYLPVRQDEILVRPEPIVAGERDAVLLITRTLPSDNSYLVMARSQTENGVRRFSLMAYQQDNFNLTKTKFLTLPKEVGNEIIRQLGQIITGDGAILLQCVMAKNFFPETPAEEQSLTPPAASIAADHPVTKTGGLPAVAEPQLL